MASCFGSTDLGVGAKHSFKNRLALMATWPSDANVNHFCLRLCYVPALRLSLSGSAAPNCKRLAS
jgi:hypothetical protein